MRDKRWIFGAVLITALGRGAGAQDDVLQRLGLDKLQITSLGVSVGRILPSQIQPTNIVTVQADYGNLAPAWRIVVNASYWNSRFEPDVVQAFVDSLHKSLANPADHVVPSQIRLYDVTFGADARYTPVYSGVLKPFFGVGLAAHVINAEGTLIKGTFVERSLDDIAAGIYLTGGVSIQLLSHFGIEGAARADLLSGFRSTQARAGVTYYFGRMRPEPR